jgi:hypothetical protein
MDNKMSENIIDSTIDTIYQYMYYNAYLNTEKYKNFDVVACWTKSIFTSQCIKIYDNKDDMINNTHNTEIINRLKIIYPKFKIFLKYWKIIRKNDIDEYIEIDPSNLCLYKDCNFSNSIFIQWPEMIIEPKVESPPLKTRWSKLSIESLEKLASDGILDTSESYIF